MYKASKLSLDVQASKHSLEIQASKHSLDFIEILWHKSVLIVTNLPTGVFYSDSNQYSYSDRQVGLING